MRRSFLATLLAAALPAAPAWAIKPFTLLEDGYPEVRGQIEFENTFDLGFRTGEDHSFSDLNVEHELEFGLSERFTFRVKGSYDYISSAQTDGLKFDVAGVEGQYYFTNPNTDKVGLSLLGAVESGDRSYSATAIFVAQKDFDRWILGYNLGVSVDVDNAYHGGPKDASVTITNALGAAYEIVPTLRVGADVSIDSTYAEARIYEGSTVYAGPVINWIPTRDLWITAGLQWQLTDTSDEPRYRAVLIVGYFF
jgi:hypothetical protein